MRELKRITPEEAEYYIEIDRGDPWRWSKTVAYTLTPTRDSRLDPSEGWEDVTYYGEGILDPTMSVYKPEWVYVLVNKSIPGICKIGMTRNSVPKRVEELNSATGVISPWIAIYKYKCINARVLEQAVHLELQRLGYRVNPRREGFEIPSKQAIRLIEELGRRLTVKPKDFNPE